LLEAAEKWHIAGNTAEEQRVRAWEKNVKTEAELLASLPDQPGKGFHWADEPAKKADTSHVDELTNEEKKIVHNPIDYQRGQWTTEWGKAFVVAKFFEQNLGDRKADLDTLADQIGAQKRYKLIEKERRGGLWW
jgi:hypothetical protein